MSLRLREAVPHCELIAQLVKYGIPERIIISVDETIAGDSTAAKRCCELLSTLLLPACWARRRLSGSLACPRLLSSGPKPSSSSPSNSLHLHVALFFFVVAVCAGSQCLLLEAFIPAALLIAILSSLPLTLWRYLPSPNAFPRPVTPRACCYHRPCHSCFCPSPLRCHLLNPPPASCSCCCIVHLKSDQEGWQSQTAAL